MPWKDVTQVSLRTEFCDLARRPEANVAALCRRYEISRTTGYRWLARAEAGEPLTDRARRPWRSPAQTDSAVEAAVLALRAEHPTWGARKLRRRLADLGTAEPPAASTITAILHRHGVIDPAQSQARQPLTRFEAAAPNDLWQLDFTGHFALDRGRCHPLPVLDDHSRFLLGLGACPDEQGSTVQARLIALFRRYGLPWRILCDHGGPWGTTQSAHGLTALSVWLIRVGIAVVHGRVRHPQTQGKLERFNRTLEADVVVGRRYADLRAAQAAFDGWRPIYNEARPHEALDLAVPLSRYAPSSRAFPERLPELVYAPGDAVRRVDAAGQISWQGRRWAVSDALAGQPVGLRPTLVDGVVEVRFGPHLVRCLSLRDGVCDPG
jgi:transposase InsO family protein